MLGWRGVNLRPSSRMGLGTGHLVGPGTEVRKDPNAVEERQLEDMTSLE